MKYREDGEYSIDNNIAERNVRPFTVDRKNTMTFGSEEGIDCAATYHTIIQTCRMMGVRVLRYLQEFFKKFSEGCRDYAHMVPGKLALDWIIVKFTLSDKKQGTRNLLANSG